MLALVAGLIAVKTAIVLAAGPAVGLSRAESIRTGLLLGQGGEFAFVVFTLANDLEASAPPDTRSRCPSHRRCAR